MSQPEYQARVTAMAVVYINDPELFAESTTHIRIEDEAAGEFVCVDQSGAYECGKIQINPDEWPALRKAIDTMISECRSAPSAHNPFPGARQHQLLDDEEPQ